MNKYELNRMEELTNRLLDRDVSSSEKSALLAELTQYPEYKETLADYEEIRTAIKNDKAIILPPKELDKAVFAEVDKLSRSILATSFQTRNKYALIGLFLLFVGFTSYFGQNLFTTSKNPAKVSEIAINSNDNTEANASQIAQSEQNFEKQLPIVSNAEVNKQSHKKSAEIAQGNDDVSVGKTAKTPASPVIKLDKKKDLSASITREKQSTLKLLNAPRSVYIEPDLNTNMNLEVKEAIDPRFNTQVINSPFDRFSQSKVMPISIAQNSYARALLQKISKNSWLLQYRGLYAVSNPENGLQGRNFYFNSYCFGGFVEAFDGVYLGAEVGAEPYSQIYLDKNTSAQFEQTPNIFYFGVAGKFAFKDANFLGIYPAAQLFAGSSSLGPITRSNLTLQYDMMNKFGMFFGVEGGMVFYSKDGVWYNSGKLGLIGGFNIKL